MKRVIIKVRGGVAGAHVVPEGVEVEIRDYDTQGCDSAALERDEDGEHTSDVTTGPVQWGCGDIPPTTIQFVNHPPRSLCCCGHTGDGANSDHDGALGHGECHECACERFTWMEFINNFFMPVIDPERARRLANLDQRKGGERRSPTGGIMPLGRMFEDNARRQTNRRKA